MDAISVNTSNIVSRITADVSANETYNEETVRTIVSQGLTEFAATFKSAPVAKPAPAVKSAPVITHLSQVVAPAVAVKRLSGRNLFVSQICASLGKDEVKKLGGMTGKNDAGVSWLSELWNALSDVERNQYAEQAKAMSAGAPPRKSSSTGGSTWTVFVKLWSAKCKELKIAYDVSEIKKAYPQFKALPEESQTSTFFNTFQIPTPMHA